MTQVAKLVDSAQFSPCWAIAQFFLPSLLVTSIFRPLAMFVSPRLQVNARFSPTAMPAVRPLSSLAERKLVRVASRSFVPIPHVVSAFITVLIQTGLLLHFQTRPRPKGRSVPIYLVLALILRLTMLT